MKLINKSCFRAWRDFQVTWNLIELFFHQENTQPCFVTAKV